MTNGISHSVDSARIASAAQEIQPELVSLDLVSESGVLKKNLLAFIVGGTTQNLEIGFDMLTTREIMDNIEELINKRDLNIIITNSHRTPTDCTDYMFERSKKLKGVHFFNAKPLAGISGEEGKWNTYSGSYFDQFTEQHRIAKYIYPGILGYDIVGVVNTYDSYMACEVLSNQKRSFIWKHPSLNIPTEKNKYGNGRSDCIKLYDILIEGGYSFDFHRLLGDEDFESFVPLHNLVPVSEQIANVIKARIAYDDVAIELNFNLQIKFKPQFHIQFPPKVSFLVIVAVSNVVNIKEIESAISGLDGVVESNRISLSEIDDWYFDGYEVEVTNMSTKEDIEQIKLGIKDILERQFGIFKTRFESIPHVFPLPLKVESKNPDSF